MTRYLLAKPLYVQLIVLSTLVSLLVAGAALLVMGPMFASLPDSQAWRLRALVALSMAGVAAIAMAARLGQGWREQWLAVRRSGDRPIVVPVELQGLADTLGQLTSELNRARQAHRQAEQTLDARTRTMDRLLDFSQTIQGVGQAEQVFSTLVHFLHTELKLAGLVVVSHEPEARPATHVRAVWPENLVRVDGVAVAPGEALELDVALCPCFRQNLPRHFLPDGSPVRSAVERLFSVEALRRGDDHPSAGPRIEDYAAYCIPFTIGRRVQVVVHMVLPLGQTWSEEGEQLAQTYINTAQSSLVSLAMIAEAEKQSMTDALTGLYNRRSMDDLLNREVALAERHNQPLSIVMIDMDNFKPINDAHGHAAGDHLLSAFASCVRMTLRKTDLAFRYGGDEFAIALPQTPLAQAQQVVQKLRQAFAAVDFTHAIARLEQQPTLSIGVAERSKATNVLTMPQLLAAADAALYDAKAANRNCVRIYQPPAAA